MAGNAVLTLFDGTSNKDFEIFLVSLSTSTSNQFATQQTHTGIWWSPIRRAEQFLQFTCVWPLVGTSNTAHNGYPGIDRHDGFGRMNHLQDCIRAHQTNMIGGQTTEPMVLRYWNNSAQSPMFNSMISKPGQLSTLVYQGWIRSVEKQFDKTKNVFYTNYYMNILTQPNNPSTAAATTGNGVTYAPTAYDQSVYGNSWLNTAAMAAKAPKVPKFD